MSDILNKKFNQFLRDEGLQPKTQESKKILERAFYTGATEYYSAIQEAGKRARRDHEDDEEKKLLVINRTIKKLFTSIQTYWKSQVVKGTGVIKPHDKIISLDDVRKGRI